MRSVLYTSVLVMTAMPALAAEPPNAGLSMNLDVVARQLDIARQQIQPSLGATTYTFSPQSLQDIPQGDNAPLNQVLLQAPGVAQDSFGQIHVRGEHANVQYRINGVELPEGLSVFGQALEPASPKHLADHRCFAGAVWVPDCRRGGHPDQDRHHQSRRRDLHVWRQLGLVAAQLRGRRPSGPVDWYVTGDFLHNNRGIENPTSSYNAIHDTTNQFHGLAYVSGIIDPDTRISMILGGFEGTFQIPNNPGQPTLGFAVNGVTDFNSANLNENQHERTEFAIISLQKHVHDIDAQISAYARYSSLSFSPDWLGDCCSTASRNRRHAPTPRTASRQMAVAHQRPAHTARRVPGAAGGYRETLSQVLPVDGTGTPTTDMPMSIGDGFKKTGVLYGVYVQDEWRILPTVTINGGLRFDGVDEFTQESQVSPRVNVVWKPTATTHLACRLRALFRAAAVRTRRAEHAHAVFRHDRGARGHPERSGEGGALELFRCRHQPDHSAGPDHGR